MKKTGILLILLLAFYSCKKETSKKETVQLEIVANDDLEIYNYEGLKPLLNRVDNKIYIINFWATWCAPCIKELPYFEQINEAYNDKNVEVILVSLDFPKQYEKKLKPYIKNNNIQSKVVAFDDPDQNKWIPDIAENWTGAIPATLIYNKDKRQFYERSFNCEELEIELKTFLNTK